MIYIAVNIVVNTVIGNVGMGAKEKHDSQYQTLLGSITISVETIWLGLTLHLCSFLVGRQSDQSCLRGLSMTQLSPSHLSLFAGGSTAEEPLLPDSYGASQTWPSALQETKVS